MNHLLQSILEKIQSKIAPDDTDLQQVFDLANKLNKEITILEFKLDRTEKVKRTTSVLLEETIEELEQKRKDIEQTNSALAKSLEELKATQSQLIHTEKMASLGELTAGIAHEIQNPLNFVNNFAEVSGELIDEMNQEIESGDLEEVKAIGRDLKQNLEKIHHHGKRADAIVKGMLQHSRVSTDEKLETDLNALADEYLRLAYHGLRARDSSFNAGFETHLDPDLPKVNVIPQDIGRVLLNLINNAFQAVHEKSRREDKEFKPKVTVASRRKKDTVEISVSDNGPGIPADIKDKIFQPFFTTKPTGQGTGLGLSLSYDIVKAHGGKLKVDSVKGEGSQFTVSLPNVSIDIPKRAGH